MYTYLSRCADEQRTDVERSSTLVCRDVFLIEAHYLLNHFHKQLCRQLGHHDAPTCRLQTCSVVLYSEHTHFAVGTAISLQSLKSLLTIMQTGGCHVQFQILVGAYFYFAPLTVAIAATYIVIGRHITERKF